MRLLKIDLDSIEKYVSNHLKLFISMTAGILIFVGIIAIAIFFISVRGAEQVMVPEVRGKELTEALLELQVKELYPRIQLRYSQFSKDRGYILEQEPAAGTIVRAGRRIRLVVSQGVILNRVENYTGRNIDEVRMDLQALGIESGVPLLSLKEPLMYDFSGEAPGTILRQKPEPGTDISGPLSLELVVSRGQENAIVTVPQLSGLSVPAALEEIGRAGINFSFSLRDARAGEEGGMVVFQDPPANTGMAANAAVYLMVNRPQALDENEVFRLFRYTIPKNPYPLAVRLEALLPQGERRLIVNVEYPGGEFTVPYRLPVGTALILSMLNREIHREIVNP